MGNAASRSETALGARLRALRIARGLSLAGAAERGSVSKSALAGWESGRRTPPGDSLAALLDALGVAAGDKAHLLASADPRFAQHALANTDHGPPVGMGEVLRAMRLRRDLTQADLAVRAQVAQSTVARWERGDQELDPPARDALLAILGATPEEIEAVASLDPTRRVERGLEERYAAIVKAPHELGEALWLGLEADLWWRAARSPGHDEMLHTVRGHRADWYAMSLRPTEGGALAKRLVDGRGRPPIDTPQSVAYGIVYSALQSRADPRPALRTLDAWTPRLRRSNEQAMVQALRARLVARIDLDAGLDAIAASLRAAGENLDVRRFVRIQKARLWVENGEPEAALLTLEEDAAEASFPDSAAEYVEALDLDATTVRALALARLGQEPPPAWMAAIRERRATRQIPLYRRRLAEIERAVDRLRGTPSPLAS